MWENRQTEHFPTFSLSAPYLLPIWSLYIYTEQIGGGIGCRQGEIALVMPFQGQQPHFDKVRCLGRQTLVSKLTGTGFIAYAYKSQALLVTQYYNIMKAFMCF